MTRKPLPTMPEDPADAVFLMIQALKKAAFIAIRHGIDEKVAVRMLRQSFALVTRYQREERKRLRPEHEADRRLQ